MWLHEKAPTLCCTPPTPPESQRRLLHVNFPCDLRSNWCRLALLSSYCPSFWLISLWRSKWPCASVRADADKPRVNFNKTNCSPRTSVAASPLPALLVLMLSNQQSPFGRARFFHVRCSERDNKEREREKKREKKDISGGNFSWSYHFELDCSTRDTPGKHKGGMKNKSSKTTTGNSSGGVVWVEKTWQVSLALCWLSLLLCELQTLQGAGRQRAPGSGTGGALYRWRQWADLWCGSGRRLVATVLLRWQWSAGDLQLIYVSLSMKNAVKTWKTGSWELPLGFLFGQRLCCLEKKTIIPWL